MEDKEGKKERREKKRKGSQKRRKKRINKKRIQKERIGRRVLTSQVLRGDDVAVEVALDEDAGDDVVLLGTVCGQLTHHLQAQNTGQRSGHLHTKERSCLSSIFLLSGHSFLSFPFSLTLESPLSLLPTKEGSCFSFSFPSVWSFFLPFRFSLTPESQPSLLPSPWPSSHPSFILLPSSLPVTPFPFYSSFFHPPPPTPHPHLGHLLPPEVEGDSL